MAIPLVIALIVLHCLFCIGLMVTFFHGSGPLPPMSAPVAPVVPNAVPAIQPNVESQKLAPVVKRDAPVPVHATPGARPD
ncbi:unnamed protein product [Echinostoma caproni]|uniref:Uncharacterized protein n=1 Tax=Echinostoma caproni TaxID=27848 RepID=A0A3P8HLW7_9TREM|nr:unnamed protein product [Echinostoma caproni]